MTKTLLAAYALVCLFGCEGTKGQEGARGPRGDLGFTGTRGEPGEPGPRGEGVAGAAGAPGTAGPPGEAGAPGAQGPAGADGPEGSEGPAGTEGPAGVDGPRDYSGLNLVALHDAHSPAYDADCTGCHAKIGVSSGPNGLLFHTRHVALLGGVNNATCVKCHSSVSFGQTGPVLRKHVNPEYCSTCHRPGSPKVLFK